MRAARSLLVALSLAGSALGIWAPAALLAQEGCVGTAEPDDTPEEAPVVGGGFCVDTELTESDQDLLLWDVGPDESSTPWQITLTGVGGTLTSLRLFSVVSDAGIEPVVVGSQLVQLDSPPEATAPVALPELLLPHGRYLLGLSRTDRPDGARPWSFDYRLDVEAVDALEPVVDRLQGEFAVEGVSAILEPSVFDWTVPDGAAEEAWSIEALTPLTVSLTTTLEREDGTPLVTAYSDTLGRVLAPDLRLAPGRYRIRSVASSETPVPIRVWASAVSPVGDPEPNDFVEGAVPLDPATPVARGRIWPPSDRDHYRLDVPADAGASLIDIRLISDDGKHRSLCLLTDDEQLQCRDGTTTVSLAGLLLAPGSYLVAVSGDPDIPPAPDTLVGEGAMGGYVLRVDRSTPPAPDFETEPNDSPVVASPFDPATVMHGRGVAGDRDVIRFTVEGEPQLWQAEATGSALERLDWIRGDGTVLAEDRPMAAGEPARLSDLYLVPGEHLLEVVGTGEYAVRLTPLGPPDPDAEREPNDSAVFAEPISLSRSRVIGRLATPADRDVFRFSLDGPERVALALTPPADTGIDLGVETRRTTVAGVRSPGPGIASGLDLLLGPGDYEVILANAGGSTGDEERYELRLTRGDPFALRDDAEPNDIVEHASPIGPNLIVSGTGQVNGDVDWYELPVVEPGEGVQVTITGDIGGAVLSDGMSDLSPTLDPASGVIAADASLGLAPRYLRILAYGGYEADVQIDGRDPVPAPLPLPVAMTVTPAVDAVAAYWPTGQRVAVDVELTNAGWRPVDLSMDTLTSHHGWVATAERSTVTLEPGGTTHVPLTLVAQPDAWADDPVLIDVRARTPDGAQVTAQASITPRRDAEPVDPIEVWPLPDAVLGGLDVASQALGASTIPSVDATREDALHDGFSLSAAGFATSSASLPITLTVDLAGDKPVPIARHDPRPGRRRRQAGRRARCLRAAPLHRRGHVHARARRSPEHADGGAGLRARRADRGYPRPAADPERSRGWLRPGGAR